MNENEEKKEINQVEQTPVETTPQSQPVQQPIANEQVNTTNVESEKLSSQLSQENQNIVTQQEAISKQIDEKKQAEIEAAKQAQEAALQEAKNNGPTTFAKIMTFLLFAALFAFVYFLGDITDYINQKRLEKENSEITSGRLSCTNTTTTDNLDIRVDAVFTFENKKITSLSYVTTTSGDKNKDKEELEKLNSDCKLLREEVSNYKGVSVVCALSDGINTVKQTFEYGNFNVEEVTSAYSEAGGVYPQFKGSDEINTVESKMIAADYSCEKVRR